MLEDPIGIYSVAAETMGDRSHLIFTYRDAPRYTADGIANAAGITINGAANAPTSGRDLVAGLFPKISSGQYHSCFEELHTVKRTPPATSPTAAAPCSTYGLTMPST